LVSAYLSSVCNGGEWFVPSLVAQGPYNPPSGTGATSCRCNTVLYDLLSACSVCQGGLVGTWPDWISFCPSNIVEKTYPNAIPADTAIPGWAYLDPTTTGVWNATQAQAYAATGAGPASSSSSTGSSGSNTGGGTNTGAIVGGVIGGIAAIIIIALLVWFFRRRSADKGEKVTPVPYGARHYVDEDTQGGYIEKGPVPRTDLGTPAPLLNHPGQPFVQYDPSNPATFPTSPAPTNTERNSSQYNEFAQGSTSMHASGSPDPHVYPPYHPSTPVPNMPRVGGGYTGAAEV